MFKSKNKKSETSKTDYDSVFKHTKKRSGFSLNIDSDAIPDENGRDTNKNGSENEQQLKLNHLMETFRMPKRDIKKISKHDKSKSTNALAKEVVDITSEHLEKRKSSALDSNKSNQMDDPAIWEKVYGEIHPSVYKALEIRAKLEERKGNIEKVVLLRKKALFVIEQLSKSEDYFDMHSVIQRVIWLAEAYTALGEFGEAQLCFEDAITRLKDCPIPNKEMLRSCNVELISVLKMQGKEDEAHELENVLETVSKRSSLSSLSSALSAVSKRSLLFEDETVTINALKRVYGSAHPVVLKALKLMAFQLESKNKLEAAIEVRGYIVSTTSNMYSDTDARVAFEWVGLSKLLVKNKEYKRAIDCYNEAISIWKGTGSFPKNVSLCEEEVLRLESMIR